MPKLKSSCPWCGSTQPPVATDPAVANFQEHHTSMEKALRLNPAMCPECNGVGGYEDWG